MGDTMKRILLILTFLLIILSSPKIIFASESIFNWDKTEIDVPLGSSINEYIAIIENGITLKPGFSDPEFYVEHNGINYTFVSVINTNNLKTYNLDFKVVSPKYKKEQIKKVFFHVVDIVPPKVVLSNPIYLSIGDKKPDYLKYIVFEDNYCENKEIVVDINDLAVDYKNIGVYEVVYKLVDLYGNQTIHYEKVYIEDNIKPVISKKENTKHVIGMKFNIEDHFTVTDNYDKHVKIEYQIKGSLNIEGRCEVLLTATDSSGNTASLTSYIDVIINEPPKVLYSSPFKVGINTIKPDYKKYLLYEDDLTPVKDITVIYDDSGVNYDVLGKYEVVYQLIDGDGNFTIYKEDVFIVDLIKPVITKKEEVSYKRYSEFNIYDYFNVVDNYDSYVELFYELEEDLTELGRIKIYLWATDSSGNKTELNSYIDVVVNLDLQIYLNQEYIEVEIGSGEIDLYSFIDYEKTEEVVIENISIKDNINYSEVGSYDIVYSYKDDQNNEINKEIHLYITDKTPPQIYANNLNINQFENIDLLSTIEVTDNYSSKDKIKISIFNTNLNTQICGTYFVIFEAVDEYGNHSYKTISVYVISSNNLIENYYIYIIFIVLILIGGSGLGYYLYKKRRNKNQFLH